MSHSAPTANTIRQAFWQTLRAIFADKAVVMVMIIAVVIYSFFYPSGYHQQVSSDQPIAVVDLDHSALSRELIRHIKSIRAVRVIAETASEQQAEALVANKQAEGVVVIPAGFAKTILRGEQGNIALYGSGAYLGRANTVLTGLAEAITGFAERAALTQASFAGTPSAAPILLVQRPLFNTREGYGSAIVTGVAELIIQQTLLIGIAVMAGTRREALGKRLVYSGRQLLGISSACLFIGFINLMYYSGFMFWYQDYPQGGNFAGLLIGGFLFIAAVVAFGLFIASFFNQRERAYQVIMITSMPLFFLSSLSWPAVSSPEWLLWLGKLVPSTAGINLMVKFNQLGASFAEAQREIVNLVLLIMLFGTASWWRYRPQTAEAANEQTQ